MAAPPIVYIVFNRPDLTRRSFAALREYRPAELFIIADGPRQGHPTDGERCQEVREIVRRIDWPCKVHHEYAEANLGCRERIISGLDRVFTQTEKAIILEDDCLPHQDFFSFCEALLDRYEHDDRVWVITGNNFQDGKKRGEASYYFSRFNHCWGWATWRRAWLQNDPAMTFWPAWKQTEAWRRFWPDQRHCDYWQMMLDRMYRNEIDTWDFSWSASVWYRNGLTATPNVNLVTNIGYGPEATHTRRIDAASGLPVRPLGPVTHPTGVHPHDQADRHAFWPAYRGRQPGIKGHAQKMITKLRRAINRMAVNA